MMCRLTVLFCSFSDRRGGAAKAAFDMFKAVGVYASTCAEGTYQIEFSCVEKDKKNTLSWHLFKRVLSLLISKLQRTQNPSKHSLNIFSHNKIYHALQDADIVHFHWFNNDTIAIEDLKRIDSQIVFTMHDEWLYAGAEHYTTDEERFVLGYHSHNKDVGGVDLNRWVWQRKEKAFRELQHKPIITAPSRWLLTRAKKSKLLQNYDIYLVPNIIDCETFVPADKPACRVKFNLPQDKFIFLYGAVDGKSNPIKGYDLLSVAQENFLKDKTLSSDVVFVTFGGQQKENHLHDGVQYIELGRIESREDMAALYNAADATIVPSRVEAFGLVAAESLACETPVLAFDYSGLQDIIQHQQTGFLAKPFDIESLTEGMCYLKQLPVKERQVMGKKGRQHVVKHFHPNVISQKLYDIYSNILGKA